MKIHDQPSRVGIAYLSYGLVYVVSVWIGMQCMPYVPKKRVKNWILKKTLRRYRSKENPIVGPGV